MSTQCTSDSSPGSPKQSPSSERSSLYQALSSFGVGNWYSEAREQFSIIKMAEGAVMGAVDALPEKTKKDVEEMVNNVDTKFGEYVVEPLESASGAISDGVKKVKDASEVVKDGAGSVMEHVNIAKEKVVEGVDKTVEGAEAVKGWVNRIASNTGEANGDDDPAPKLSTSSLYQSLPSVPTTWYQDAKNQYGVIQATEGAVVGAVTGVCKNVPDTYKAKAREMVDTADGALGTYVAKPLEKTSGMMACGAEIVKEGVSGSVEMVKGGINVISNGIDVVKERVGEGVEPVEPAKSEEK